MLYDPSDPALAEDPYPTYRWLREHEPVQWNEQLRIWAVARHADVVTAFSRPTDFTSRHGVAYDGSRDVPTMLELDPPDHTRMRRIIAPEFTKRRAAALADRIRAVVTATVETLEAGPGDTLDVVADVGARLPTRVAASLLGCDHAALAEIEAAVLRFFEVDELTDDVMGPVEKVVEDVLERRRREPADDLATVLRRGRVLGRPLGERELLAMGLLVLLGGQEPTTTLFGAVMMHVGGDVPASIERLFPLIDEAARLASPTQYMTRTATHDVDLGGTTVRSGDRVVLLIASANRDEHVFADPDDFRLGRAGRSLAFGAGPHICLGQWVARTIVAVAVQELAARYPRLDVDPATARWAHAGNVRRLDSVLARVG